MERYTVDSIADGMVSLLLRRDEAVRCTISQEQLPGVREGDIISAEIRGTMVNRFRLETGETESVKARIEEKLQRLKNRSGK